MSQHRRFFNFFYLGIHVPAGSESLLSRAYFFNIPLIPLGLPGFLIPLSAVAVGVSAALVLGLVVYSNIRKLGRRPSPGFLIPWIAFHVWWLPVARQPEFYLLVVPFAHALQYLPFAYRLEIRKVAHDRGFYASVSGAPGAFALSSRFCAFELVPSLLDSHLRDALVSQDLVLHDRVRRLHQRAPLSSSMAWRGSLDQPEVALGLL